MNSTVDYQNPAAKVPLSERVNLRIIAFLCVIVVLVGYPVYVLISEQYTGGIHNSGRPRPGR